MHSLCTNRLDFEGLSAKLTFESRNKDLAWNGMGWRWVLEEREMTTEEERSQLSQSTGKVSCQLL